MSAPPRESASLWQPQPVIEPQKGRLGISMTYDAYAGFAERYDFSFGLFGKQDPQAASFFRRLFAQKGVRAVLDCACGTGRHLPLFHSLGCQVVGSDASAAMLVQARKNLAGYGVEFPLVQADFRDLPRHFPQPFGAVVCLGAIGLVPGEAEVIRAFTSMRQVLRQGGILVLTAIPTDRQWAEKPRYLLAANRGDFSRLFVIDYRERSAQYDILDIFHDDERDDLKVWSADLHVFLRDDQERLLRTVGFQTVEFYGAYDFTPYNKETSNSLITVACL